LLQEGTTTAGNALIQFKPGAFLAGLPVQPCVIRYHNERHNPGWVAAGHPIHIILLRLLCEPVNW
jgi:1-acyl-sn-glycerol-3-phosphate acyltransferase